MVMTFHVLVTERNLPIPAEFEIIQNWGEVTIINHQTEGWETGEHMLLRGGASDLVKWQQRDGKLWMGVGHPQLQQFEHARDPAQKILS